MADSEKNRDKSEPRAEKPENGNGFDPFRYSADTVPPNVREQILRAEPPRLSPEELEPPAELKPKLDEASSPDAADPQKRSTLKDWPSDKRDTVREKTPPAGLPMPPMVEHTTPTKRAATLPNSPTIQINEPESEPPLDAAVEAPPLQANVPTQVLTRVLVRRRRSRVIEALFWAGVAAIFAAALIAVLRVKSPNGKAKEAAATSARVEAEPPAEREAPEEPMQRTAPIASESSTASATSSEAPPAAAASASATVTAKAPPPATAKAPLTSKPAPRREPTARASARPTSPAAPKTPLFPPTSTSSAPRAPKEIDLDRPLAP